METRDDCPLGRTFVAAPTGDYIANCLARRSSCIW